MYQHCLPLALGLVCLLGVASARADDAPEAKSRVRAARNKQDALFDQLDANHDGQVSTSDERFPSDKQNALRTPE